jgi:hypothetical protein
MSTVMPEVEEALLTAIERDLRLGRKGARRTRVARRRPTLAGAMVLAGVLPALVIAAIALTFLSHARPSTLLVSPSAGGVRGFKQELAILRRPQTAADRLKLPARDGVPPRLTRLAAVVDEPSLGRVRIYVAPFHPIVGNIGPPSP